MGRVGEFRKQKQKTFIFSFFMNYEKSNHNFSESMNRIRGAASDDLASDNLQKIVRNYKKRIVVIVYTMKRTCLEYQSAIYLKTRSLSKNEIQDIYSRFIDIAIDRFFEQGPLTVTFGPNLTRALSRTTITNPQKIIRVCIPRLEEGFVSLFYNGPPIHRNSQNKNIHVDGMLVDRPIKNPKNRDEIVGYGPSVDDFQFSIESM